MNTTVPGCVQTEQWRAATTRETALSAPPYSSSVRSGSVSGGVLPLPEGKSGHTGPQANRSSGAPRNACHAISHGVIPADSTVHSNAVLHRGRGEMGRTELLSTTAGRCGTMPSAQRRKRAAPYTSGERSRRVLAALSVVDGGARRTDTTRIDSAGPARRDRQGWRRRHRHGRAPA